MCLLFYLCPVVLTGAITFRSGFSVEICGYFWGISRCITRPIKSSYITFHSLLWEKIRLQYRGSVCMFSRGVARFHTDAAESHTGRAGAGEGGFLLLFSSWTLHSGLTFWGQSGASVLLDTRAMQRGNRIPALAHTLTHSALTFTYGWPPRSRLLRWWKKSDSKRTEEWQQCRCGCKHRITLSFTDSRRPHTSA